MSFREPEVVGDTWKHIFHGCGILAIVGSLLTFVAIVVWLNLNQLGNGFGSRPSNSTTAQYFNWHPLLMSAAFLLFMVPAVVSFEIFPFLRHTNKTFHGWLNTLAFLAALCGFAIILDCHNNLSNVGSFHSVHGCNGLVVISIIALNYLLGFVLYVLQIGGTLRASMKPFHKRLGLCGVILGLANIILGLFEQELKKNLTGPTHQFTHAIAISCALTLVGVIFTVAKFMDKKDVDVKYAPIVDTDATNKRTNYGAEQL